MTNEYTQALRELYLAFKADKAVDVTSVIANSDIALDLDESEDAMLTEKARNLQTLQWFFVWAQAEGFDTSIKWHSCEGSLHSGFWGVDCGRKWAVTAFDGGTIARCAPVDVQRCRRSGARAAERAIERANDVVKAFNAR